MTLHWGISLLTLGQEDLPLVTLKSENRSISGEFNPIEDGPCSNHFIDLGAHQGESIAGFINYCQYYNIKEKYSISSYESSRQAQIWSPLTATAMRYEANYQSMYVSNYAVSGKTGIADFRDDGSAGSSLHPAKPLNRNEKTFRVPTVGIGEVISNIPDNVENLILKINIEGGEYDLLKSLLEDEKSLCKITEIWLDFHGHQFKDKWKYLFEELEFVFELRKTGIKCYDVDFMSGFYKGYDLHPPCKKPVTYLELINQYM